MHKIKVCPGSWLVEIPEENLSILCGVPQDVIKFLKKEKLIEKKEKNGVVFESGPNAILLSDIPLQHGQFTNLAEFPILQIFYRQGKIIPGHPNNDGKKPLLLGSKNQINAQAQYILRGNYGLISEEELREAGLDEELIRFFYDIKTFFAFGKIKSIDELLEIRAIDASPVTIGKDLTITRKELNVFEFRYQEEIEMVDLNIYEKSEVFPYELPVKKHPNSYWSIINTGEGTGWDVDNPCMSSILVFNGKLFLIDAGPSVLATLKALGIHPSCVAGIFHTHCHDDHFAGITSLIRTDHKLGYYAVPVVRLSVQKKLSALTGIPEKDFMSFFSPMDLVEGQWNSIEPGFEVMPLFSPHPVETTIMYFRATDRVSGKQHIYAHLADISSLEVIDNMRKGTVWSNPVNSKLIEKAINSYFIKSDIKKIDAGKGMIHGNPLDFLSDSSDIILLSHIDEPLSSEEKKAGLCVEFGTVYEIFKESESHKEDKYRNILIQYYPFIDDKRLDFLLQNSEFRQYEHQEYVLKPGEIPDRVFYIVDGLIEMKQPKEDWGQIPPGSVIGEGAVFSSSAIGEFYRAYSYANVFSISTNDFMSIFSDDDLTDYLEILTRRYFLRTTWFRDEPVSSLVLHALAKEMTPVFWEKNTPIESNDNSINIIKEGRISMSFDNGMGISLGRGEMIAKIPLVEDIVNSCKMIAETDCRGFSIAYDKVSGIPMVSLKIIEEYLKRSQICGFSII
ncbi:cyclic nucleotide-binding domain-containing protein [Spirochaetia bacterium 38H-sp]|uniref:Cyclic nucleotide-binding domain-containing protein n=1 Tax=Rarispira pelagica TaxID=3141764 RepID=A0ABU9UEI2_9SPIR